jgi:hypothetical protein
MHGAGLPGALYAIGGGTQSGRLGNTGSAGWSGPDTGARAAAAAGGGRVVAGADRPINVAVEGTTFSVDTGADGGLEGVVAEGVVTLTVPGAPPRKIENGRRVAVGAGGGLREAVADRETITRIRDKFTETVIRDREHEEAGFAVVGPGGVLRERNVQVDRVRVVQEIVTSGMTSAEQTAILTRVKAEGRPVIKTAEERCLPARPYTGKHWGR